MWDGDGQPLPLVPATQCSVHGSQKGLTQRSASARGHRVQQHMALVQHVLVGAACVCGAEGTEHAEWKRGPWRVSLPCFGGTEKAAFAVVFSRISLSG